MKGVNIMAKGYKPKSMYDIFKSEKQRLQESEYDDYKTISLLYNEKCRTLQYITDYEGGGKDILTAKIFKEGAEELFYKPASGREFSSEKRYEGIGKSVYYGSNFGTAPELDVRYIDSKKMPENLKGIVLDYAQERDSLNLETWTDMSRKPHKHYYEYDK